MPFARLDALLKAEGSEQAAEEIEHAAAQMEDEGAHGGEDPIGEEVRLVDEAAVEVDVDLRVELVRREIESRQAIGGKVYPFEATDDRVSEREACGRRIYLLLLVLGTADLPYRIERRAHEVEQTYDEISLAALRRFLGRGAQGVRFARTAREDDEDLPDDPMRRPTSFPAAIAWLRDLLDVGPLEGGPLHRDSPPEDSETVPHWEDETPALSPPGRAPLTSYNDAGVDVVVWWKFADGRRGFPVLLAQCTVQLTWGNKVRDIDEVMWQKWIDFDTSPPQKALVIPFAPHRTLPQWRDRTTKAGVIIDRIRLIELLDELECTALGALVDDEAAEWTRRELAAV